MLNNKLKIKKKDFGLSQIKPKNGKVKDEEGAIPGTPIWMAPEVMMGRPVDDSADVYSFAITLWEIRSLFFSILLLLLFS